MLKSNNSHPRVRYGSWQNDDAPDFSRWEKTEAKKQNTIEVVHFIAGKLLEIAETLKNPEFFETMAARVAKMDPAELAPRPVATR